MDPASIVRTLLRSFATGDFAAGISLLANDIVWLNTGTPTLRGSRAVAFINWLDRSWFGFDVELHSVATTGDVVFTDRTDYLTLGPLRITGSRVCGIFTVREGRIVHWDDRFKARTIITGTSWRRHEPIEATHK